jgi:hypothetical protein
MNDEQNVVTPPKVHAEEAATLAGEIAGALLGSAAGPVGTLAGMVIGALAGTVVGAGMDADAEQKHAHERELDEAIGVQGGDLGAAKPGAPPAVIGAFSMASSGAGGLRSTPAEGPIQAIDED